MYLVGEVSYAVEGGLSEGFMCGEYGEGRAVVVEGDAAAEGGVGVGVRGEGACVVSGKGEVLGGGTE